MVDQGKLAEIKEAVANAVKQAIASPEFDYDLEAPDNFLVASVAEQLYPLIDVDYFRRYRHRLLSQELAALEAERGVPVTPAPDTNEAGAATIQDVIQQGSNQPLYEVVAPDGSKYELWANGWCVGFPPGSMVVNRAWPLINALASTLEGPHV